MIIDKEVKTILGLQRINCKLNLLSAMSVTKILPSKPVNFQFNKIIKRMGKT